MAMLEVSTDRITFTIGDITLYMQVHIISNPAYDILTAAAARASFNTSSNSVSMDQIMSTRWSPNIVACVGDFAVAFEDTEDGKLISMDCTNSAKPAGLRGCS